MRKRLLALCLTFAMPLSLTACGGGGDAPSGTPTRGPSPVSGGDGSWAVYWYLCGSELETNGGCATIDP